MVCPGTWGGATNGESCDQHDAQPFGRADRFRPAASSGGSTQTLGSKISKRHDSCVSHVRGACDGTCTAERRTHRSFASTLRTVRTWLALRAAVLRLAVRSLASLGTATSAHTREPLPAFLFLPREGTFSPCVFELLLGGQVALARVACMGLQAYNLPLVASLCHAAKSG